MKSLKELIIESKEEENNNDTVDFETFIEEIDKAFEEAKIDIVKDRASVNQVLKRGDNKSYATYDIILGKKEGKSKMDTGAKLGLSIDLSKDRDELGVYIRLNWTNGKMSYSIYSNAPKNMRYELNLGKINGHTLLKNWAGGHDFYELTPDIASCVVDGIKYLKYEKDTYNAAMEKSRFTSAAWDKLCKTTDEMFKLDQSGRKLKWSTYPWNA